MKNYFFKRFFLFFELGCDSRKMRLKRVVRVPAISLKMADIPPDDYSWRKYGQKPIKGSPHPRYFKFNFIIFFFFSSPMYEPFSFM
jgi:hypothetical protein